jgi:toxin CcdB
MGRYDVHRQPDGTLLIDPQASSLDSIRARVVAPLLPRASYQREAARLNPVIDVEGRSFVVLTQALAAVPAADLGPVVANLDARHDEILAALDMLFLGF